MNKHLMKSIVCAGGMGVLGLAASFAEPPSAGVPETASAPQARVLAGPEISGSRWTLAPSRLHGCGFEGYSLEDPRNPAEFFLLTFIADGAVVSSRSAARPTKVFSIVEPTTDTLYELYHVVENQGSRFLGYRIKSWGPGLCIDLVTTNTERRLSGVSLTSRRLSMGDTFLVDGQAHQYPGLPLIANQRQRNTYPMTTPGTFVSNTASNKGWRLCPLSSVTGCAVDTSINSDGVTAGIEIRIQGPAPVSFFFDPGNNAGPLPPVEPMQDQTPDWVRDAVRRSLDRAEPLIGRCQSEIAGMASHVRASPSLAGDASYRAFQAQGEESLAVVRRLRDRLAGRQPVTVGDWFALGLAFSRLQDQTDRLRDELAMRILF